MNITKIAYNFLPENGDSTDLVVTVDEEVSYG